MSLCSPVSIYTFNNKYNLFLQRVTVLNSSGIVMGQVIFFVGQVRLGQPPLGLENFPKI